MRMTIQEVEAHQRKHGFHAAPARRLQRIIEEWEPQ